MPSQFSIRTILKQTFAVIRTCLPSFAAIAIAFIVLWHIPILLADRSADEFSWWNFVVARLAYYLIGGSADAALIYGTLVTLRGGHPSLRQMFGCVSFVFPVIAISFITDLPSLGAVLLDMGNPNQQQTRMVQVVLGICTYILFVLWFVARPAVIAEGLGVWAALTRSVALTRGKRWPVFGFVFVGGVVLEGVRLAAINVSGDSPASEVSTSLLLVTWLGTYMVPAISTVFWAVSTTIVYCALRLEKEGVGVLG